VETPWVVGLLHHGGGCLLSHPPRPQKAREVSTRSLGMRISTVLARVRNSGSR